MYHTFYTISDLNYAIFSFFVVFFLLTIKDKKYNVYNLAFLFFILGLMAISYFFSFGKIESYWAYHRWFSVGVSLVGTAQLSNFLFHYPKKRWKFIPKITLLYQIIAISITIIFIYKSLNAPKVYNFDGHFWDVDLPYWSKIVGMFILLFMIFVIITGFSKSIIEWKESGIPILLMTSGFILEIFIPGITNLLNRLYIVSREFHHNVWVLIGILGSFIVIITYINYTKEKTTLLTKIYAITIATLLIIFQYASYFVLRDRENIYDENQKNKTIRVILDKNFRPLDLISIGKISKDLIIENISNYNEFLLQDLYDPKEAKDFSKRWENIPQKYIQFVKGYDDWIQALQSNLPLKEVLKLIDNNKNKILLLRKSILELPENNFKESFIKDIYPKQKDNKIYKYFLQNINMGWKKKEILSQIPIFYRAGERVYKYLENKEGTFWDKSFVCYYFYYNDELYFVVYSYKAYREFINDVSSILFYLIILSTMFILLSYPIFFYLSMIKPLRRLVYGLKQVDKGNFGVFIDVYVEDELGYVTRSFNKMVDSIRTKNRELEEYANKLEEKVKERTKELENSLKEIEKLKEKQDGDYFLTSLLLKPLNVNEIIADPIVNVNIILNQFKKFNFRHWHSEIGGDFCSAYQINLRKRDFIFCVNADAMGKSIQGAGGALVLGSVLESIVERTRYEETVRDLYPEMWLKNTFVELHRVFESFDGSMLVSCILLLLDKKNGCIYHLNAEHPYLILYRNHKASFLEPEKGLMKLGVSVDGLMQIQVDKLKMGDILIMGSDGKDDLVLEEKDGRRIVNDDETLFLKVVEESQGNLELIYNNLSERGEFMDDLSMISIEYKGDMEWLKKTRYISKSDKLIYNDILKEIKEKNYNNIQKDLEILSKKYEYNGLVKKQLALLKLEQKQYKEAIQELEKSFEYMPWNSNILKMLSKLHFKVKNYEKSRVYGELYIIRKSNDKEMINFLIKVYEVLKNHTHYSELAINKIEKYKRYMNV